MITQKEAQELFHYDRETGLMWWIKRRSNNTRLGTPFKFTNASHGYIVIRINNKLELLHRVAWVYANGDIPAGMEIDHIDGDKLNNKLSNLRMSNHQENNQNKPMRPDNTSGYKGVWKRKGFNIWYADVQANNRKIRLGPFSSPESANKEAVKLRESMHKEFVNHG